MKRFFLIFLSILLIASCAPSFEEVGEKTKKLMNRHIKSSGINWEVKYTYVYTNLTNVYYGIATINNSVRDYRCLYYATYQDGNYFYELLEMPPDAKAEIVMSGSFYDYPNYTIEDLFTNFFSSPKWKYFVSDKGVDIVEFSGGMSYSGNPIKATIQFVLNKDNSFKIGYLGFNDIAQNQFTINVLLEKLVENRKSKAK